MIKRRRILLLVSLLMLIILSAGGHALAAIPKVYDDADLFSPSQREVLEQKAVELSEQLMMDLIIVTTNENGGKTSREYADDFYDEHGFGYGEQKDGLLMLINMGDREVYISTSGTAIQYFTDNRIDLILDKVSSYLADEAYSDGANSFMDEVESYVQAGIPANQQTVAEETETNFAKRLFIYLVISIAIGGISVGIMALNNRGTPSTHRGTYLDRDSFHITESEDHHLDTKVTQSKIERNSGNSNNSSTTHHSSGGNTHGGGGRKF